jgi:hypothetical protein
MLHNDELYQRTAKDLPLKCLETDQTRIAMGEVHEGICGTHQSALKMKWLLRRAGFYWPTMMTDCFRYYKGCEECQRFGNIQLVPAAMTVAFSRLRARLHWSNSFPIFQGASLCVGCYRLFH